jgi:hypothetical protein
MKSRPFSYLICLLEIIRAYIEPLIERGFGRSPWLECWKLQVLFSAGAGGLNRVLQNSNAFKFQA